MNLRGNNKRAASHRKATTTTNASTNLEDYDSGVENGNDDEEEV